MHVITSHQWDNELPSNYIILPLPLHTNASQKGRILVVNSRQSASFGRILNAEYENASSNNTGRVRYRRMVRRLCNSRLRQPSLNSQATGINGYTEDTGTTTGYHIKIRVIGHSNDRMLLLHFLSVIAVVLHRIISGIAGRLDCHCNILAYRNSHNNGISENKWTEYRLPRSHTA